jgi:hypothetical protein
LKYPLIVFINKKLQASHDRKVKARAQIYFTTAIIRLSILIKIVQVAGASLPASTSCALKYRPAKMLATRTMPPLFWSAT